MVHECMLIDQASAFAHAAAEFLELGELGQFARMVIPADEVDAMYGELRRSGPEAIADRFAALGQDARRQGFDGLRVVADVTPLLRDPHSLRAYRHYELVIDRRMRREGCLFGLCVVDASQVDVHAQLDVCRMHEVARPPADFRIYTSPDGYRLGGDVDGWNAAGFARILEAVVGAPLVRIDLAACHFLDHLALRALDDAAASVGAKAVLEHASPVIARLVGLLELQHVEVAS